MPESLSHVLVIDRDGGGERPFKDFVLIIAKTPDEAKRHLSSGIYWNAIVVDDRDLDVALFALRMKIRFGQLYVGKLMILGERLLEQINEM
jgi:hypothetical protein